MESDSKISRSSAVSSFGAIAPSGTSPSTTAAKSRVGVMVFSGAAVVYKCTENLRAHKAKQYPAHYGSSRTARYRDDIAKKKVCADCVGLIKGYNWTTGGQGVIESIGTDRTFSSKYGGHGCPDKSANGMFSYAKSRGCAWGTMDTLPEIPGIALRFDGHVGVYIGGGYAVEERGFNYGCVKNEGFFPEVGALVSAALRGLWRRGVYRRQRREGRYPGERVYHEPNRLLTTRRAFHVKNIPSRLKSLRISQRITALRSDGRAFQPRASSTKSVFRCF